MYILIRLTDQHYNIVLIHDVIDGCKCDNVSVCIVSLDQEKAFHRVDHSYLFSALKSFGIGDVFLAWVSLVKVGCYGSRHDFV